MISKKQIEKLKIQLLERKEQLLLEVTSSQTLIKDLLNESSYDELDYAEISSDSFNMSALRDKQIDELKDIDIALQKIKNGTYGICDMCDEEIGLQRLKAKPHARFCVDCRPIYEESLKDKQASA
jgi:DnaK suppressor protein